MGAAIAVSVTILVFVLIVKYRRVGGDDEEMSPHPKTSQFPGKSPSSAADLRYDQQQQSDDAGYEFLPVFNKGSGTEVRGGGGDPDAEYDIPQAALTGLPSGTGPTRSEYEVMSPLEGETAIGDGSGRKGGNKKHAPPPPKGSKEHKKKQKSSPRARKPTYENVDKEPSETPPIQGGKAQKTAQKSRKHDYLNVDAGAPENPPVQGTKAQKAPKKHDYLNVDAGAPVNPPVQGGKAQKAPQKSQKPNYLNVEEGPSAPGKKKKLQVSEGVASSTGMKSTDAKTKAVMGKGSPPDPPPPPVVFQQQEGGSGFKAMRQKMANSSGASVVGEGQSATLPKRQVCCMHWV